ncbi:MAG: hypothetical protein QOK35_2161 [Pseudonocardiales bacterium]|nr:hypothetical protein [Pseudonocardiales bacterium]
MSVKRWCSSIAVLIMTMTAAAVASTPAHAADYWTVLALARDEKGQEVPIRLGDGSLGYTKAYCLGTLRCPDDVNRSF